MADFRLQSTSPCVNTGTPILGINNSYRSTAPDLGALEGGVSILGDFTLRATSPCIDVGVAIAGINDGYRGSAPDLGFLEGGASITTWYLDNPEQSNSSAGLLTPTQPTASTSTTGWIVGNLLDPARYSRQSFRQERAAATFTATPEPSGTPLGKAQDCWRISAGTSGTFSAGTWYSSVSVIAVTSGGTHNGRALFRLWRSSNEDGTGATELTALAMLGSNVTGLSTTVAQSSSASVYISSFSLSGEYLFLQAAWENTK